jgi:hypothetical protein
MTSFKALPAILVARSYHRTPFLLAIVLLLLALGTAYGQQPAVGRKRAPRLTTEDVTQPAPAQPAAESSKETAKAEGAGKPDEAKADAQKSDKQSGEAKASTEEAAWRDRVRQARERATALQRTAEEAELRITQLRNDLSVSGQSARNHNQTVADLDQAGQQISALRNQARAAKDDLEQLLQYGKEQHFTEAEGPKSTADDGKPNEDYYRSRYTALREELQTAERRMQLYDNRVRDYQQRILNNSGNSKKGGDNFYTAQLQQDRDEAQHNLDEARTARDRTASRIEALIEEARRAGVAPGVFR